MKKLLNHAGFSLIEMLATLLILVLLVVGIGTGMSSGMRVYEEAIFESDSSSLAGILNNAIGDVLRYSVDVRPNTGSFSNSDGTILAKSDVDFVFTSFDYGIRDAYMCKILPGSTTIQMRNLRDGKVKELVNTGAYPRLKISNFSVIYTEAAEPNPADGTGRGGFFEVSYDISDINDDTQTRHFECVVRLMNV